MATGGFDYMQFFKDMSDSERLQVSRDELDWIQRYVTPERTAEVVLALSCGAQTTPYVMLTQVAIFEALGLDFVATAGQAFCCGNVFHRTDKGDAGDRMARTSMRRFAAWEPAVNVQCCGSCYVQFHRHAEAMESEPDGAPFEVVHFTQYLLETLRRLGDAVPWRRPIKRRVLLHAEGAEMHATKEEARQAIIETLALIPGVEYVGLVKDPTLGAPCQRAGGKQTVTSAMGDEAITWALEDITSDQYRQVQAELEGQARELDADVIATPHHACHREWSKFGSERLPITYYASLVAEALGIQIPDRFQILWRLGNADEVLEMTRPHWQSWDIEEAEARSLVRRFFVPKYAAAVQKCPCEGNCFESVIDTIKTPVSLRTNRPQRSERHSPVLQ